MKEFNLSFITFQRDEELNWKADYRRQKRDDWLI